MRRATTILASLLLLLATGGASAFAELIVYEGFDAAYTAGNIAGQNVAATGLTGAWATNTATIGVAAAGLNYPGLYTKDQTAQFTWVSDLNGYVPYAYRALSPYEESSVYYLSGLMSFSASFATDANSYARMGFLSSTGENEVFGVQWGFRGNGNGGVDAVVRVRDYVGGSTMNDYVVLKDVAPGTHLFVVKVEPDVTGINDRVSIWLDPADLSSETAAGTPAWQRNALVWVPRNPSYLVDTLVLKSFSVGDGTVVGYDEARMGETWADAVPVVPEPSSGVLLLGLSVFLGTTRRRLFSEEADPILPADNFAS